MTVSDNSVPRDVPPFRADHVGSFLRPESVRKARLEAQQGLISPGGTARCGRRRHTGSGEKGKGVRPARSDGW